MKPRELSTRERVIYDRLTLHARAALAPMLARAARKMLVLSPLPWSQTLQILRDEFCGLEGNTSTPQDLALKILDSLGGAP